jgi:hypothetical protein
MRKVYLNTAAAKDALSILTKGELLEQLSEPTEGIFEFKTTEKGRAALAQYYQLITYFFETKLKGRPLRYVILPLLLHLPHLISDGVTNTTIILSSSVINAVRALFLPNKE